ncbi:MAG: hypothetical protein MUP64_11315, partial [Anaerolineae bacterium]|nr:hypothetical protein [Anaerolineae bacterium]
AMNRLDRPEGVWILPLNALASPHDEPGHHTVEFLYRGEAPFHFLRLDESTVAGDLTTLTTGRDRVMLVDYKNYVLEEAYNYIDADPKQLLPFLLSKESEEVNREEFESFDVRVYPLVANTTFSIADSWHSISTDFGGQLQLSGVSLGARSTGNGQGEAVPSGGEAWVVLQWRTLTQPAADYKVAIFLLDQRDRVVGQVDKPLLSNHMRLTSEWEAGQVEMDYYLLPTLPATPPGDYDVQVVVYDPSTMQRLMVRGDNGSALGDSFTAAQLQIARPASPPAVEPMHTIGHGALTADLSLLGYDLPRDDVNPGDRVGVALYWRALLDITQDYLVQLQLRDTAGRSHAQEKSRPAYGTYPANLWEKGEVVRDWHDLRVPAEIPSGEYALYLALESEGAPLAEVQLGTIRVSGRARCYEIPPMDHELGWRLGDVAMLLGYDVDSTVQAGEMLGLTLYWQCVEQGNKSYAVFVHLLDQESAIRGQLDGVPAGGEAPTTSWVEGEVIRDQREIAVDAQSPEGEYLLEVGMYDPKTAQRLPVYDAHHNPVADRILLQEIGVEAKR